MKRKFSLTAIIALFYLSTNAQISLEHFYPTGGSVNGYLQLVKLSSSGYKYVIKDTDNITLYSLNHSVFTSFPSPSLGALACSYCPLNIYYLSEALFDTDASTLEYFIVFTDLSNITHCRVYNQAGNILFSKDDITLPGPGSSSYGSENFISYTPSGFKMIIYSSSFTGGAWVYSLPGTLPCHTCSNDTITSIITNNNPLNESELKNYPNPSAGQTTVEYNLPKGVTAADLIFYNLMGQEIKRFKVTSAFHNIIISIADLDAGTYYYELQTQDGYKEGKKMIVVK